MLAALLLGCLRAVQPVPAHGAQAWEGDFAVEAPPGWTVTRNGRLLGAQHFALQSPDQASAITVDLLREDFSTRELPLRVVSESFALNDGRSLGIEAALIGQHRLAVDGREAWATTVHRRHGPQERVASVVALRVHPHVVVLTLHTVAEAPAEVVLAWERALASFELADEGSELPPFLHDNSQESEVDALPGSKGGER